MEQTISILPTVKAGKLRKKKETFYFILIVLVSLGVWGFSLWGFYSGIQGVTHKPVIDPSKLCFGTSQTDGSAFVVPDEYKSLFLENGETCSEYGSIDPKESEKALKEYQTIGGKTEQGEAGALLGFFVVLMVLLFFGFFTHLYALAFIRMTGVRVGQNQFPQIWESAQRLSSRLGMKKTPDVFILNGEGMLNAFATKLIFRKLIVLYSDLAEALSEPEYQLQLDAVLGHELGHHALGHTKLYHWLLYPGEFIPFISFSWSREREYSADRVMQALISESDAYERGLMKLAAGKMFGQKANIDVYIDQIKQERGFMVKWAEYFSTHPFLPKRIRELRRYKEFLERNGKT